LLLPPSGAPSLTSAPPKSGDPPRTVFGGPPHSRQLASSTSRRFNCPLATRIDMDGGEHEAEFSWPVIPMTLDLVNSNRWTRPTRSWAGAAVSMTSLHGAQSDELKRAGADGKGPCDRGLQSLGRVWPSPLTRLHERDQRGS